MHGWGGVGHVLTFMCTCGGRICFSVAAGRCMYARVGACIYFHVNLRRTDMLLCGYCKFSGTFHGTFLSYVMLCDCKFSGTFHAYVMLRDCKFSGTFHSCVMPRNCKFSGTFHSYVMPL